MHFDLPAEPAAPKTLPLSNPKTNTVNTAFSGMIVERDAIVEKPNIIGEVQEKEVPQEEEKPKRVSLFKANRNKP